MPPLTVDVRTRRCFCLSRSRRTYALARLSTRNSERVVRASARCRASGRLSLDPTRHLKSRESLRASAIVAAARQRHEYAPSRAAVAIAIAVVAIDCKRLATSGSRARTRAGAQHSSSSSPPPIAMTDRPIVDNTTHADHSRLSRVLSSARARACELASAWPQHASLIIETRRRASGGRRLNSATRALLGQIASARAGACARAHAAQLAYWHLL